jgi:hypothetical protein
VVQHTRYLEQVRLSILYNSISKECGSIFTCGGNDYGQLIDDSIGIYKQINIPVFVSNKYYGNEKSKLIGHMDHSSLQVIWTLIYNI